MWVTVLFDLPVETREQRKAASQFRNRLIALGFEMAQCSVYSRMTRTNSHAERLIAQIEAALPKEGDIRILPLPETQRAALRCYVDGHRQEKEEEATLLVV